MKKVIAGLVAVFSLVTSIASADEVRVKEEKKSDYVVERDRKGDLKTVDDAVGFGEKGQWAVSAESALSASFRHQQDADTAVTITILPAADYFVRKNLSVGAVTGIEFGKAGDSRSLAFVLGPRVGYNIEFSKKLSLWPRLGLGYTHTKARQDIGNNRLITTSDGLTLSAYAPVMMHPAQHVFFGFGPFFNTDLSGDNRATIWGLRLAVGGWL